VHILHQDDLVLPGFYDRLMKGTMSPGNVGLMYCRYAFMDEDGFQCGYCTPGQICSAIGMLAEVSRGIPSAESTDDTRPGELTEMELKERMSGNLCRCGAYVGICDAIRRVHDARRG